MKNLSMNNMVLQIYYASLLMLTQFVDRDHYFIDTSFIPLVLLLGFLLSQLLSPKVMLGVVLLMAISVYVFPILKLAVILYLINYKFIYIMLVVIV